MSYFVYYFPALSVLLEVFFSNIDRNPKEEEEGLSKINFSRFEDVKTEQIFEYIHQFLILNSV